MVFSSVPAYLDPSNWQQQHIIGSSSAANALLPPPPPPPPPHGSPGSGSGSIRPGSMSERARLANIPMPETALKCPRCESTNTKFCYFNNYSLSQPRHFCKTCRRYWTRGGALRSVPVGGGCRRNKRTTKSTSSKSPASSNDRQTSSTSTSTISTTNNNNGAAATTNLLNLTPPQFSSLRFMSPLGDSFAVTQTDMGLNYSGIITAPTVAGNENMNFHHGSSTSSLLGLDPWRLQQQFPFLGGSGLDPSPPPPGVYNQFQGGELGFPGGGETINLHHHHHHPQARPKFSTSLLSQLASVKMEDQNPDLRLSRQLLGGMQGNNIIDHQWNNNNNNGSGANNSNWTDLSSFSSSSTSNPLQ